MAEAVERDKFVSQRRRMIEKRMTKAEQAGDHQEASIALDELLAEPPVVIPRLVADDITVEALVRLLAEQNGRLALLSTEGGLFDAMAGRYTDAANLDPYLQAWSGDTIRSDRVSREATIVRDGLLTVGLTVQPSVIAKLADKPEFVGRGLTARFMYSVPVDFVGYRDLLSERSGDAEACQEYERRLARMLEAPMPDEPVELALSTDARTMFAEWRQELERRRTPSGDLRPMATWTTKLESTVIRLAGLFHVAGDGVGTISVDTMRRALDVGAYWLAHAQIVHDMWGTDETLGAAKTIVRWITETKAAEFSIRDIYRGRRGVFSNAEATVKPLELLVERGWIRPLFDGPVVVGRRGVESPKFRSYPQLLHDRNNHVTHGAHVPKDKNQDFSSSSEGEGGREAPADMDDMGDNRTSVPFDEFNPF